MPRLRNAATGVVVNVSDEKAERLGSGWVAADAPTGADQKRAPRKSASK